MYSTPVLPAPAIGGITLVAAPGPDGSGGPLAVGGVPRRIGEILPNAGAPMGPVLTAVLVVVAVAALAAGVALVRRGSKGRRPRPVLRAAAWAAVTIGLAGTVVAGRLAHGVPTGWDLVGTSVAVLTLGYAVCALRSILPVAKVATP